MSKVWKGRKLQTPQPAPRQVLHPIGLFLSLLMITTTGVPSTLWEGTWCLRRATLLQCVFQSNSFDFILRSIWHVFACSESSWVTHSTQEQKLCIENTEAKGGVSHIKGWGGQLSEGQKQHKIPGKVLCLLLPWHYSVYYTSLFNWQIMTCAFHAFHALRLRISFQSEWPWVGTSNAENRNRISEQEFGQAQDSRAAAYSRAKLLFLCAQEESSKAQSCQGRKTILNVFSSCKQYYLLSLIINYFLPICSKEDKFRNWKCSETVPSESTSCSQHCKCIPH